MNGSVPPLPPSELDVTVNRVVAAASAAEIESIVVEARARFSTDDLEIIEAYAAARFLALQAGAKAPALISQPPAP